MDDKKEIKFDLNVLGGKTAKTLKHAPSYGCLKNGIKPTFRQTRQNKVEVVEKKKERKCDTIKHYTTFGKKHNTVRVLIKDSKTFKNIDNEKKRLEKHSLEDVCAYLTLHNLYTPGSNAPEEVLREIYRNAYLAGNVTNINPQVLYDNYAASAE